MGEQPSSYVVRNALLFAFRALRHTERLQKDSLCSPYEDFYTELANALSPVKKIECNIPNSEVEKFYNKRMSENDFVMSVQSKILCKLPSSGPGTVVSTASSPTGNSGTASTVISTFNHLSLLFSVVWGLLVEQNKEICSRLPNLSGRQLWEIFLKLDTGMNPLLELCVCICACWRAKRASRRAKLPLLS